MAEAALEADVVIVGAGLAGLSAARAVEASGAGACVLEARERVGGRTERLEIEDGGYLDIGGQWLGPTQDRMYELCREHGIELFPTWTSGESVIEIGGRTVRYSGTIPRLSPAVLLDVHRIQRRLERMARQVPVDAPWLAVRAEEWDSQTLWSWLRAATPVSRTRELFTLVTKAVWAAMPGDVSLLHVLFYIASAGGLDPLLDTAGGAQQDRFVAGAQSVSLAMADGLAGPLRLGCPVRRIEHGPDGVAVHADGVTARGRRAIVAIPPTLAGRIDYEPALPARRDQLTQRMFMGSVIKWMCFYSEPFWRAQGLSGEALSTAGPASVCFDNSPPDGTPGVLVGFFEGREARVWGRRSEEERRRAVTSCLTRLLGPRAGTPTRYLDRDWSAEPWSRGCYVGFTPPGVLHDYGPAIREPIGRLHWAGTETASRWNGYMEGAVRSGERAAREALEAL